MFCQLEPLNENTDFLDPSNKFENPLIFEDLSYPTIWHFLYAMKTRSNRQHIIDLSLEKLSTYTFSYNPDFSLREDWLKVAIPVMDYALRYYFSFDVNKTKLLMLQQIPKIYDLKCDVFWFKTVAGDGENWYFELIRVIQEDLIRGIDINKVTFKNDTKLLEKYKVHFMTKSFFSKEAIAVNKEKEKCDVYVGRGSDFGNPFPVFNGEFTLEDSLRLYSVHLSENVYYNKEFRKKLLNLKGKKIGCFCPRYSTDDIRYFHNPANCHACIIANYANTIFI